MEMVLIIAGLTIVGLVIRYAIRAAINKGVDAVSNAIVDKKNKTQPHNSENLADRYKDSK